MEFPHLGEHCSNPDCHQLDFTPFKCQCSKYFCKEHFLGHALSEECSSYTGFKDKVFFNSDSVIHNCHSEGCRGSSFIEMPCEKCNKHFCISHRFHLLCYELNAVLSSTENENLVREKEKEQKIENTRQQIEAEITQKLRNFEKTPKAKTAIKILLMKLKSRAVGGKKVSLADRIYFEVRKPSDTSPKKLTDIPREISCANPNDNSDNKKAVYISKDWPLGRVIDSIADICNVKNDNSIIKAPKLRLFRESDGMCIRLKEMSCAMSTLLEENTIIDGERVILDYISAEDIATLNENNVYFLK